jgi:hypothetical protein
MFRSQAMPPNGLFVRSAAIAFVALKPVVGVVLGERHHTFIPIHLRHHRGSCDRDAVAVCLHSGHDPKGMWQMFGDIVNTSIEEQDRRANRHTTGRQCQESPNHSNPQSIVDSLGINLGRTCFPQCVMREPFTNRLRNRPAPFLGDGLRVIKALWPALDTGIPDNQSSDDGTSEGSPAHLVAADNAGGTLGRQLRFELERGLYSAGREGSLDSMPTKVSG